MMDATSFSESKADAIVQLVGMMPTTSDGKPMNVLPWQRDCLREFYGRLTTDEDGGTVRAYQYLYLELTKKQGKTELAAAIGAVHLIDESEHNPEIYLVAADRENASICFRAIVYKLEHTPYFASLIKKGILQIRESTKTIRYRKNGGILRVLSADADTKHGYKPSCVIFDELHAQPNRKLWDVMTFGAGDARRQPVWIVLTTAGDDPDRRSIGWEVHQRAVAIRDARRLRAALDAGEDVKKLPFLRGADPEHFQKAVDSLLAKDDPAWLPVLYGISALCSDDDEQIEAVDIYDESVWRACNPSIGTTVKLSTIRAEARAARQSEAQERLFRWLRLNQWIATKSVGWIPLTIYDKTQWNGDVQTLRGKRCYGGLDLSSTTDLTAFVLFFPPQKGLEVGVALARAWTPSADLETREYHDKANYRDWARAGFLTICEGDTIDYEAVKASIYEAQALYDLQTLGVDPYLSRTITQELMEHGLRVVEIPQTIAGMWPAMWEMEQKIRKHEMQHVHNTALRYCFGNVRCASDGNGNLKPMKNRSRGRIDMLIGWIIAVAACLLDGGNERTLADAIDSGWQI